MYFTDFTLKTQSSSHKARYENSLRKKSLNGILIDMKIMVTTKSVLRLTARTAFFLLAWSLILFTLFLLGNYQQFLDYNQRLIMTLLSITLILEIAACLLYLLLLSFIKDKTYHPGKGRVVILILALIFSVILFVILEFFYAWLLS